MTDHPRNQLSELIALTRLYVHRTHSKGDMFASLPEYLSHFSSQSAKAQVKPPLSIKKENPQSSAFREVKQAPIEPIQFEPIQSQEERLGSSIKEPIKSIVQPKIFEKENSSSHSANFLVEPVQSSILTPPNKEFVLIMQESFPSYLLNFTLLEERKTLDEAPITILLFKNHSFEERQFLGYLADALSSEIALTQILDVSDREGQFNLEKFLDSENRKLILGVEQNLREHRQFNKSMTRNQEDAFLGKIPLILLSTITSYLENPHLKPILWKSILKVISTSEL